MIIDLELNQSRDTANYIQTNLRCNQSPNLDLYGQRAQNLKLDLKVSPKNWLHQNRLVTLQITGNVNSFDYIHVILNKNKARQYDTSIFFFFERSKSIIEKKINDE